MGPRKHLKTNVYIFVGTFVVAGIRETPYIESVDLKSPPIRRSLICTEPFTVRLDKELKADLLRLSQQHDVDVPEWVRSLLREGVKMQLEHLKTKPRHAGNQKAN